VREAMLDPEAVELTDELQAALKDDLRRFWGRVVYFLGMLAGFIPLLLLPSNVFTGGNHNTQAAILVQGFNLATVLPASVLAFWSRKVAAWWLVVDGVVLGCFAAMRYIPGNPVGRWEFFLLAAVPLFLGGFGVFTDWKGWPRLVDRKKTR
jgi:hypothetical protein